MLHRQNVEKVIANKFFDMGKNIKLNLYFLEEFLWISFKKENIKDNFYMRD